MRSAFLASILSACFCAPASAEIISFSFTGTLDSLNPELAEVFAAGDELAGDFTLDLAATGVACKPVGGCFSSPAQPVSATLGSFAFSGNLAVSAQDFRGINLDEDAWSAVATTLPSQASTFVSGQLPTGLPLFFFQFSLNDPSGTALDGSVLVPPVFDDYAQRQFVLWFGDVTNVRAVYGTLTSLVPIATPEAGSASLLTAALSALVIAACWHSNKAERHSCG